MFPIIRLVQQSLYKSLNVEELHGKYLTIYNLRDKYIVYMVRTLIFQVHGHTGGGDQIWHPWITQQLTNDDTIVLNPTFPDSTFPDFNNWNEMFKKLLDSYEYDRLIIVGHSLGGYFTLRNLSDYLYKNNKLVAIVLVAPVTYYEKPRFDLEFLENEIKWEVIKSLKLPIKMLYSLDDDSVKHSHRDLILN